jgi:hypothetical protein
LSGGAVSPLAFKGNNNLQVAIRQTVTVKARILDNGKWSPINEATFVTPTIVNGLALTEIMYNPESIGNSDGDNYEFIELKNTGPEDINLSQYAFTSGIFYTFPDGTNLKPNEFVVLASDAEKFRRKYDFYPDGTYRGNLNNGGDSLVLTDPFNVAMISMAYNDSTPWPLYADSGKYSLVTKLNDANVHPEKPESWRLSYRTGGSPRKDDLAYVMQDYSGLLVSEIMYWPLVIPDSEEEPLEFIEIKNTGNQVVNMAGVHFSDGIEYTFYYDKILNPNDFIVLVKDNPAFFKKYGFYGFDEYAKGLSNSGETLILSDPNNNPIYLVNYATGGEWPLKTNGFGYSLVPVKYNSSAGQSNPDNWRASFMVNGSPGKDDTNATRIPREANNMANLQLKNQPNPFADFTNISFTMEKSSEVSISIYNSTGQLVKELLNKQLNSGAHNVAWHTADQTPGIYLIVLQTPGAIKTHKCLLMR